MVDGGVPFPMLSDTGGKVGKIFGVFDEEAGVENRGRFIITKKSESKNRLGNGV